MSLLLHLTALPLFALLAFSAPSIAQRDGDPWLTISMMPLRADEITFDAERGYVRLRGRIDWPDGRTMTGLVVCEGRYLTVQDHTLKTEELWSRFDPDLCYLLGQRVQPRR
jgi:hypothetical protein